MIVRIDVMLKSGVLDLQGRAILKTLNDLGSPEVLDVQTSKTYTVSVSETCGDVDALITDICSKLLVNDTVERYSYKIME